MKELELKLTGGQNLGEIVVNVDESPVKFKKNEFGSFVGKIQTDNDKANIKVFRMLDVGGLLWFVTQLFFFVISIFGIFDVHHKERCLVVDFECEVDLKEENKITLQPNSLQEDGKAIDIQTDLTCQEVTNKYYLDENAKKKLKILKFTKIFLALAIIGVAIAVLFIKL